MTQMLGKYELISKLATGGMAEVFLARERGLAGLERLVVIKRMLPHLADDAGFVQMFLREARLIARINHPNIVHIHELGTHEGRYFIALEYIHGVTMRELQILANEANIELPIEFAVVSIMQACRGLHAAHELRDLDGRSLGVIHRDISPHNLMCTSAGHIKLLDFGVAKITEVAEEATYSGELKGKFSYMSPEQCMQRELDQRSDLFSLGIVLWELCTGRRLFKRPSNLEMMQAITRGEVIPASTYNEAVPPELDQIILRALTTSPEARWSSADAMRRALLKLCDANDWSDEPESLAPLIDRIAGETLDERRVAIDEAIEAKRPFDDVRLQMLGAAGSSVSHAPMTTSELSSPRGLSLAGLSDVSVGEDDDEPATAVSRPRSTTPQTMVAGGARKTLPPEAQLPAIQAPPQPPEPPQERQAAAQGLRRYVPLLLLLAIAGFIGARVVLDEPEDAGAEQLPPIRVAWVPTTAPEIIESELAPLHKHLSKRLGRRVVQVTSRSYADAAQMLKAGEVEFAVLPPLTYVMTHEEEPGVEPIALRKFDGSLTSDGLLLVSQHSPDIQEVADLRGKKFCEPDPSSTTGAFLPRAYLRRRGYNPDEFIGEIHWSGDHVQVIRDLLDGRCDVGASYSGAILAADRLGVPVSQLRTLAITGNVPQDVLCAAPGLDPELMSAMREVALEIDSQRDFGVARLGDTQRFTGFAPVTDSTFDILRTYMLREQRSQGRQDAQPTGGGHAP